MIKKRLIPVLLLKNGWLVQSKIFSNYQNLGNPITAVKRLSEWAADELIYLDISKDETYDIRRDDQGYENITSFLGIIEAVSKEVFMPMTIGGKIKNPMTDKQEQNLEQASFYIDLLDMMQNKMKGNLSEYEEQVLINAVSELKLNYIEEQKKPDKPEKEDNENDAPDNSSEEE